MFRKIRIFLISIFIGLLFIEVWVGFPISLETGGSENPAFQNPMSAGEAGDVDKHMEGVHFVESRAGARDWEMFAKSAEGSQTSGSWIFLKVRVLFYSSDAVEFTVTGKTGTIDTQSKNLRIVGDVVVTSKNGYSFQTNAVHYLAKERVIESEDKVRMTAPGPNPAARLTMTGDRLRIFVDTQDMQMNGHIHAEKNLDDGRHMTLVSESATASGQDRSMHFIGEFRANLENTRLEGARADLQYEKATDLLQSLDIVGSVRLSDLSKYATADQIQFLPRENQFILKGSPRVVQNNDEITGEQIVFTDGGRKIRVDKMKARVERTDE